MSQEISGVEAMGKYPKWVYELAERVLIESIKYPTVLGESYREITEFYSEVLSEYGVHTTLYRVPDDYTAKHLAPEMKPEKARYILLARIGSGDRTLQYNGHYDVVAPGEGWCVTEPFNPKKIEDRVYGRGSTDMKGGIAAFLAALAYLAQGELNIVVEAAFVPDEEIGGAAGTGYLVKEIGSRPTWVVIAEPSGIDNIWIGHKGLVWCYVKVYGKQVHGSTPWLGDNAFEKMVEVAKYFIEEYIPRLQSIKSRYSYDLAGGEHPTATLGGKLIAPGSINIVPGVSGFSIDRRLIVEERADTVAKELEEFAKKASEKLKVKTELVVVEKMDPALTDPESQLVKALTETVAENIGRTPRTTICIGGLDMRYYTALGIETVTYGPGEPGMPHKVNEYVKLSNVYKAVDVYIDLAYRLSRT